MQNSIALCFFRPSSSAAAAMAEFGRGTAADLHHPRPLPIPGSPLVACRICDAVFSSSQALINHIGAHVSDEGATSAAASRRQNQQRSQTHRFPPGPPFLTPPRASALFLPSRFSAPNSLGFDAAESLWPNQLSPFARSLFREAPPPVGRYFTNLIVTEEAVGDCTKPYINQLEKCLPKVGDGGEEDNGRQLYFSKLDLTLKL
ncbi:unnamed protein product [Citrullus colocynthis]|uniref:C2H2-type domain-containing protein n=1 Tax=Citrullus colocynthis TaxID=252529 RepID=A0ABP0Z8V3_9ROSI